MVALTHYGNKPTGKLRGRIILVLAMSFLPGGPPAFFDLLVDGDLGAANSALAAGTDQGGKETPIIRHVDLVHFSHTDFGYTDHPFVCRENQRRYLDIAIDAVLATRNGPEASKFFWTAEGTVAVRDWWEVATPVRRAEFLEAVASGQLDISALPFNQTPTLNRRQWHHMMHWLPEELWQQVKPKAALQNDVNGVPRAGAVALLDRDIRYLFTGINQTLGGAPLKRPTAFWWKMPDGRRMFVWLNFAYPMGFSFFDPHGWRRGPVPEGSDTRYRPPRPEEILRADEASVRQAHRHLVGRLRGIEAGGYAYPTLLISMTNEWRMDNDPPFPPLADFVAQWTRLKLKPTLRLTTVARAMSRLEREIGGRIPEHEGEWPDWWANGVASGPREVAASRRAKRLVSASESDIWGKLGPAAQQTAREIHEDLCLFDEHTWGYSYSISEPYCLESLAHYNEKSRYAYRSMGRAKWLLSQRVRSRLVGEEEGLYVANPSKLSVSGWVNLPLTCLREAYRSLKDPRSGAILPLEFRPGLKPYARPQGPGELTPENTAATFPDNYPDQAARFWLEKLDGGTIRKLQLRTETADRPNAAESVQPKVEAGEHGWPTSVFWEGMKRPLFLLGLGDLTSVSIDGFAPRWIYMDLMGEGDDAKREKGRKQRLMKTAAVSDGKAAVEKNLHTTVYTQTLRHPRLARATRRLELFHREPRATLTLRLNRISSEAPEVFFVLFPLPCEGAPPRTSNGGLPFVPYEDQLPGTCRDYFSIDDWVHYQTPHGDWLWVSRDAPLVTFGAPRVAERLQGAAQDTHKILARIFDNTWFTNFVGDSHGPMEFRFDLVWRNPADPPVRMEDLAESLQVDPPVLINPTFRENPILVDRLYR